MRASLLDCFRSLAFALAGGFAMLIVSLHFATDNSRTHRTNLLGNKDSNPE